MLFALLTESVTDNFVPGQSAQKGSKDEGVGFFQKLVEGLSGEGGLKKIVQKQSDATKQEAVALKKSVKPGETEQAGVDEKKNAPTELKTPTTSLASADEQKSVQKNLEQTKIEANAGNVSANGDVEQWERPEQLLKFAIQTKTRLLKALDVENNLEFQRLSSEKGPKTLKDIIQLAENRQLGLSSVKVVIDETEEDTPDTGTRNRVTSAGTDVKQPVWISEDSIQVKIPGQESTQLFRTIPLQEKPLQNSMTVPMNITESDWMDALDTLEGFQEKDTVKMGKSFLAVEQLSGQLSKKVVQAAQPAKSVTSEVVAKLIHDDLTSHVKTTKTSVNVSPEAEDTKADLPSVPVKDIAKTAESKVRPFWYLRKDEMPHSHPTNTLTQKSTDISGDTKTSPATVLLQDAMDNEQKTLQVREIAKKSPPEKLSVTTANEDGEQVKSTSRVQVPEETSTKTEKTTESKPPEVKSKRDDTKFELNRQTVASTENEAIDAKKTSGTSSNVSKTVAQVTTVETVNLEEKADITENIQKKPNDKTFTTNPVSATVKPTGAPHIQNDLPENEALTKPLPTADTKTVKDDSPKMRIKEDRSSSQQFQSAQNTKDSQPLKTQNTASVTEPAIKSAPTEKKTVINAERPVPHSSTMSNRVMMVSAESSKTSSMSPLTQLLSLTEESPGTASVQLAAQSFKELINTQKSGKQESFSFEKIKTFEASSVEASSEQAAEESVEDGVETLIRDKTIREEMRIRQESRIFQAASFSKSSGLSGDSLSGEKEKTTRTVLASASGEESSSIKEAGVNETVASTRPLKNDLFQKVAESKETLRHFSMQLSEQVKEYKPPISRIRLELNPKELGSVEVTLTTRGTSLVMNLQSNTQALQLFMQNAQEFRNALGEVGFSDVQMNFGQSGGQNPGGEGEYREGNENRLFSELEEDVVPENIEITIPRYI